MIKASELNVRGTFKNWESSEDSGGGVNRSEAESFERWMKVEYRSGVINTSQSQDIWTYDVKITIRKDDKVKSNTTVDYEGVRYKIREVIIPDQGFKDTMICRGSKVDENI